MASSPLCRRPDLRRRHDCAGAHPPQMCRGSGQAQIGSASDSSRNHPTDAALDSPCADETRGRLFPSLHRTAGGDAMTHRRRIRFDPPISEPLNDGVVLLVRGVQRGARGLSASLQIWNEHLIHADDFAISTRHGYATSSFGRHPPSIQPLTSPCSPRRCSSWLPLCRR